GDWVGTYGADGYVLANWNSGSDEVVSDWMTVSLGSGSRSMWASTTTEDQALESPDETFRRAATYYSSNEVQLTLDFANAYSGDLHLYSVDWDTTDRRQTITVDDGNGPQSVAIDGQFDNGAWTHFTVDVPDAGTVTIAVTRTGGANAVLSGIFLGNDIPSPPPPPPPPGLGDWVGTYGADGYVLA
ncbi:MAG: hypothetical protein GY722_21890, partial [bacterium]|nr:hypothetical protein [bacterium]